MAEVVTLAFDVQSLLVDKLNIYKQWLLYPSLFLVINTYFSYLDISW